MQSGWTTSERNDGCKTASFLKQSDCEDEECRVQLMDKWHKIKCVPISFGVSSFSCSRWCHKFNSFLGTISTSIKLCLETFRKASTNKMKESHNTGNRIFDVIHCRSFLFIVRLQSGPQSGRFTCRSSPTNQ